MTGIPPEDGAGPAQKVGIDADNVVGSNVYQDSVHNEYVTHKSVRYELRADASPEEKYRVGLAYLRDGCPSLARELISDARAKGHDSGEVRFHLALALLSRRSYRDLDEEERERLIALPQGAEALPANEWTRALIAVSAVLACYDDPSLNPASALQKLDRIADAQRRMISKHLALVLTASIRESLWAETRQNAREGRLAGDRRKRVWAYFHPVPAKPRHRPVPPSTVTTRDRLRTGIGTLVAAGALGCLGWTILSSGQALSIVAYVLLLSAGCAALRTGLEWRHLAGRLAAKERLFSRRGLRADYAEPGFAQSVDAKVRYYFAKFAPRGIDNKEWRRESAGIQTALRNELVDTYRESRTTAGQVYWLIHFHAREARRRWTAGSLFEYHERYRVRPATKLLCVLSCLTLLACSIQIGSAAVRVEIVPNAIAAVLALVGALAAVPGWAHIVCERRRIADEAWERMEVLWDREAEYRRWKRQLDDIRPREEEMEDWLGCDRTMILDKALTHYKLAWRDVLAYAFLQTPGSNPKQARLHNGPWRYTVYDVRLFLITVDGVREFTIELDFERVVFGDEERTNYRFDAVSSVHVTISQELRHTLELTLLNGQPRQIRVIDDHLRAEEGEDARKVVALNLDTAGFKPTLHILEGIAAEGKGWIDRDPDIRAQRRAGVPGGA
ncbi:hypothetical protein ATK36_2790 [Amycolatopsis sulphurea]|uniref:Uncharacterized protein n=1 Tax=Amycolatopsis sulphurea TaxID=76022 RepID=A0A2A9FAB0_9PSEU|nr:hypothetical protein [Amycolatopsis sulphurea]PFG47736.1 hypothetical protein ATK36_2790 [Amycolatopsis sulphurea]